jgi:hypothetical protein
MFETLMVVATALETSQPAEVVKPFVLTNHPIDLECKRAIICAAIRNTTTIGGATCKHNADASSRQALVANGRRLAGTENVFVLLNGLQCWQVLKAG